MMGGAVDGVAAANYLLGMSSVTPGYCLKYVWQSYQAQGAVSDGKYYPTAYSAWQQSSQQVPGDRNVPAGFPVYLGPRAGSSAGDVVISLGGGMVAATDWPHNGVTGKCSLTQRINQTGRPYLGWTRDILGAAIQGGGSSGGGGNATITNGADEMFVISNNVPNHPQRGTAWVAIPQGNGKPRATTLFGGDVFPGAAVITIVNQASWDTFAQSIQWA